MIWAISAITFANLVRWPLVHRVPSNSLCSLAWPITSLGMRLLLNPKETFSTSRAIAVF